ncbi:hypothetical protein V6Z11_D09G124800 [Gossypium hirsutum]
MEVNTGFRSLANGEEVKYVVKSSEGRPRAVEVTGPNGNPVRGPSISKRNGGGGAVIMMYPMVMVEGEGEAVMVEVVVVAVVAVDVISVVRWAI